MSTVNVSRMQESSVYASDPARERATMSRQVNNEKGEGSSNGYYDSRNGDVRSARDVQYPTTQHSPYSPVHSPSGAPEAGSGDQERAQASPRPSGIGLATYQALAHDPVYMAARTSPIGPPPRAALPALPPVPSSSSGPPPRDSLPEPPSQQQQQQRKSSGMLAMASESRPVTAVYNGYGDWEYPASSSEARSNMTVHGGSEASSSAVSQHRSHNSGGMAAASEQGARSSTSASQQRRQEPGANIVPDNRAPSTSRYARHGTDASSTSSPPGPSARPTSSNGVENGQRAEGSTEKKMASKTVLTIALLEAQKAVDLDESDQAEAAIISYSKSVELLQEVMRRVSENAGTYRRREMDRLADIKNARMARWKQWRMEQYRKAGVQVNAEELHINDEEIETREERRDREKRETRIARRERMREEECAKLRVIHDTYAERVRALKEETAARDVQYAPALADGVHTMSRSSEATDTSQKLAGLSINGPAEVENHTSRRNTHTPIHSRHMGQQSVDNALDSASRAGIGSAMLADLPVSPTFQNTSASISASPPKRVLASAVPFPASSPSSQNNARLSYTSSTSTSPPSLALPEIHPFSFSPANSAKGTSPSYQPQKKQSSPPMQHSILSFSPDSETSDNTAFSDQEQSPGSRAPKTHRKNASSSASFNKTLPNPEGYATFGDLAAQASLRQRSPKPPNMPLHSEQDEMSGPEGLATPTPDTAFSKAFAPHPTQEDQKSILEEPSRSRAGSRASNALRHMTSNESMASTTTSSSAGREQWDAPAPKMPLPPMPNIPQAVSGSPPSGPESIGKRSSRVEISRPLRSASLVAGQPMPNQPTQGSTQRNGVFALASESQRASALLINPSTLHGTISQRRKSPQMPDAANFPSMEESHSDTLGVPQSEYQGMSGLGLTRTSSTERGSSNRSSVLKTGGTSPNISTSAAGPPGSQPFNVTGSLPMRLRALSQPSKRPGMSPHNSELGSGAPPLPTTQAVTAPNVQRSDSDPSNTSATSHDLPPTPNMPSTPMSFEYLGSIDERTNNHSATNDDTSSDQMVSPTGTYQGATNSKSGSYQATSFMEPDTPASVSFQQNAQLSPTKVAQIEYQAPPSDIMRVPFHFMRQIRASILSGAYLTPRLYIPKQLWSQSSMKLIHTETKVRMLDLLLNGLESIERIAGDILLIDGKIQAGNVISKIDAANKLMRELESFEGMLDSIQSTLAKKLPYIEQPNGKKGGGGSFGAWSSKLSRSMDRMTKGKNLDAPETYVAAIARLCLHAQILDRHLVSLHGDNISPSSNGQTSTAASPIPPTVGASSNNSITTSNPTSGYNDIPTDRRAYIEMRLKRTSDFFSKVICKMLLNDLGIWLDKYSKRAAGWTTD